MIFLLTQVFITPVIALSAEVGSGAGTAKDRIAGVDRYKTAVAVAQKGWETSDYAVLARGDDFADALCAAPLAQKYGGPILLTQPKQLNADTLTELKRLGVKHLFIAGGSGAIAQSVEDTLQANGIATIERLYGYDRYETSVKIAQKIGTTSKVVLAPGNDFPDALSISGIAAKLGMPILLTAKDSLPASVGNYFRTNSITQTYVVGGTAVISDEVANGVPAPSRLAGIDRYATNVAILQSFASELNFDNIYVATGINFADALSGAVLAAKSSSPLVLIDKTMPTGTANYLQTKLKLSSKVFGLGGSSVVPSAVLTGIVNAKEQIPVEEKYSTAGTYGPETGSKTIQGSVIISARDVTLKNTIIEGDLLLGGSIGDGNVTLRDVTVKGKTIINGGGPNSIIMYNFNGQTVVVDVPDGGNVRLLAQGSTSLAGVSMESDGILEESGTSGNGFVNVAIPEGVQVTFIGAFAQVNVEASGASINLPTGSSITTLNANAASNITGQGQITAANVKTDGVTIERTPTNTTTVASGLTAMVGGTLVTGTNNSTPSGGGGGGGGGGSSQISVTAIGSITGTAQVGVELTAGALTPSAATVGYQWTICDTIDGTYTDISGATVSKYTPVGGDVDKFIKVVATGIGSYSGTVTSVATSAVELNDTAKVAADKTALVDANLKGANADLSNITGALTNPLPATGSV
ncbi:cell wall-binding repeat-containing protein, partial [Desulfosporosinus lacus]